VTAKEGVKPRQLQFTISRVPFTPLTRAAAADSVYKAMQQQDIPTKNRAVICHVLPYTVITYLE
jgi:hypothetical protein